MIALAARGATSFSTLVSFSGTNGVTLGATPEARLVRGSDGSFYGTTLAGGTSNVGTLFKVTTNGAFSTLFDFSSSTNGDEPQASLIQGKDGNLYGTTGYGSPNFNPGMVFRITTKGVLTPMCHFQWTNGSAANGVIQAGDGNFYGTTLYGGANSRGTVFRITAGGSLTTLYSFGSRIDASQVSLDGAYPQAALVQASDGALYGTTVLGGTQGNFGTVFRITTNGNFRTLISFNGANGANPLSTLIQGFDGNLYGTTSAGGRDFAGTGFTGNGNLFGVTTNGSYFVLHEFAGSPQDGAQPNFIGLTLGTDGSVFGTTFSGGAGGLGTVFRRTPEGASVILHSFSAVDPKTETNTDGAWPSAGVTQGSDGALYGTAEFGGAHGNGTLFRISDPSWLAPRIRSVTQTNGNISFTWIPLPGRSYQVQSSAKLNPVTWANEGNPISGSGPTMTALVKIGAGTQRCYRLRLLP